jgi:uncharacterized protein
MIAAIRAPTAAPQISINSADITTALSPNLIGCTYTDHTADKADDLQIELEDPAREWIGPSFPQKGASIDAVIICADWRFSGDIVSIECGNFTIDSISFKGPPNTVSIKANSIPHKAKIKNTQKTRAWENTSFEQIARQIGGENGLKIRWDTQLVPRFGRIEQIEESPLAFLKKRADDCGLSIKITKGEIVFFDEESYEAKEPKYTIRYGDEPLLSYSFSTKLTDIYGSSTVSYQNPETGRLTTHTFKPQDGPETEGELRSSDRIEDEELIAAELGEPPPFSSGPPPTDWQPTDWTDDAPTANKGRGKGIKKAAERKAKKQLREKNKKEQTAEFMLKGEPLLAAGMTVAVVDFERFDGNYIVDTCVHTIRGGYTTKVSLRKCLKGY